jgi:hypothetical protein
MDNRRHSPLFGSFDDTGAIKGLDSYRSVGLPPILSKVLTFTARYPQ